MPKPLRLQKSETSNATNKVVKLSTQQSISSKERHALDSIVATQGRLQQNYNSSVGCYFFGMKFAFFPMLLEFSNGICSLVVVRACSMPKLSFRHFLRFMGNVHAFTSGIPDSGMGLRPCEVTAQMVASFSMGVSSGRAGPVSIHGSGEPQNSFCNASGIFSLEESWALRNTFPMKIYIKDGVLLPGSMLAYFCVGTAHLLLLDANHANHSCTNKFGVNPPNLFELRIYMLQAAPALDTASSQLRIRAQKSSRYTTSKSFRRCPRALDFVKSNRLLHPQIFNLIFR